MANSLSLRSFRVSLIWQIGRLFPLRDRIAVI